MVLAVYSQEFPEITVEDDEGNESVLSGIEDDQL